MKLKFTLAGLMLRAICNQSFPEVHVYAGEDVMVEKLQVNR